MIQRLIPLQLAAVLVMAMLMLPGKASAILQKGQPAPPFKVVSTSGQQITEANYKGHVLLIDFFATWCNPCRDSIPHLIRLNQKYGKQGLQILGASLDEDGDKTVRDFCAVQKVNYPVAIANEDMQTEYGLRSIPTLYVINKKGIVAEKFMGFNSDMAAKLDLLIKQLLAE
ncbi:MAG: TlpA family protein disulfide reductase [Geobacter sp.]|nr:TlpA family protein disulfide reductase [Geobacter sp.]